MPSHKSSTIEGTVFKCEVCDDRFRAGSAGFHPLFKRVQKHANKHAREGGYLRVWIVPINPKPGMIYRDLMGNQIGKPYAKGQDVKEWLGSIYSIGAGATPAWELAKEGSNG